MKVGFDASVTRTNQAGTGVYAASLLEALRGTHEDQEYQVFSSSFGRDMARPKTVWSRLGTLYNDVAWMHA
ncbi:MAG: hypothetical protein ACYC7H_11015, partial [Chloroflexota bacterium]